jgi:hypothetical protein
MKIADTIIFSVVTIFLVASCEKGNVAFDSETDSGFPSKVELGKKDNREIKIDILFIENNPVVPFFVLKNERSGDEVTYTYSKLGKTWIVSPHSFTSSNTVEGDVFVADYIPDIADAVTGVRDVLQSTSSLQGNLLSLSFEHVNSTLTLHLVADSENENSDFLKREYLKESEVHLWNTYLISGFNESHSITLEPQIIKKGSVIEVLVKGMLLSDTIQDNLILERNKNQVLTLHLNANQSSISTEISTEKDIITPGLNINFSREGTLVVFISGWRQYTYKYDGEKLLPTNPYFYWADLTVDYTFGTVDTGDTKYELYSVFTPSGEGFPEKDIMVSPSNSIEWGETFGFDSFTHTNSFLEIRMQMGKGYTDDEWSEKKRDATLILSGICSPDYSLQKEPYNAIVQPRKLKDTDILKLTFNDTAYTIRLNSIPVNGEFLTSFEAGKSYVISVTVSKERIPLALEISSTEISNWKTVEAPQTIVVLR